MVVSTLHEIVGQTEGGSVYLDGEGEVADMIFGVHTTFSGKKIEG